MEVHAVYMPCSAQIYLGGKEIENGFYLFSLPFYALLALERQCKAKERERERERNGKIRKR
jgi:hypothetical protein